MTRLLPLLAAAVVLAVIPSCKKPAEFDPYDNTSEREAMTWRDWRDAFLQQYHELYATMRREAGGAQ